MFNKQIKTDLYQHISQTERGLYYCQICDLNTGTKLDLLS